MLENQFVQLGDGQEGKCDIALPVVFGSEGTSFFFKCEANDDVWITLVNADATKQYAQTRIIGRNGWVTINLSQLFTKSQISAVIKESDLFRVVVEVQESGQSVASQLLCYRSSMDGLSVIKYKCDPDTFGFPFSTGGYAIVTLPILLTQPQYGQEDKTYTKSNGDIVVLYAQHRKEWSGETEYLPEHMHDKIVTALACDEVYINGDRVTKDGSYDVNWDNYDQLPDGTKTARATFKVRANTLSRNSNY